MATLFQGIDRREREKRAPQRKPAQVRASEKKAEAQVRVGKKKNSLGSEQKEKGP